jgi:hypothetical protein
MSRLELAPKRKRRRRAVAVALVVLPIKLHSTWWVRVSPSGAKARVVRLP